jgi:hypothetical protein
MSTGSSPLGLLGDKLSKRAGDGHRPGEPVDEEPAAGGDDFPEGDAEEEGHGLAVEGGALEDGGLDQPGEKDRAPDTVHDPAHARGEADGMQRRPGPVVAGEDQRAHQ